MYIADAEQYPGVFPATDRKYFLEVWRDSHMNELVRVRKYARFTKCDVCQDLKGRKLKHGSYRTVDPKVKAELIQHYKLIGRYRARAMSHAMKGKLQPEEYLSMAQDGTEQMGYGYPTTPEFTVHTTTQHTAPTNTTPAEQGGQLQDEDQGDDFYRSRTGCVVLRTTREHSWWTQHGQTTSLNRLLTVPHTGHRMHPADAKGGGGSGWKATRHLLLPGR